MVAWRAAADPGLHNITPVVTATTAITLSTSRLPPHIGATSIYLMNHRSLLRGELTFAEVQTVPTTRDFILNIRRVSPCAQYTAVFGPVIGRGSVAKLMSWSDQAMFQIPFQPSFQPTKMRPVPLKTSARGIGVPSICSPPGPSEMTFTACQTNGFLSS